VCAPREGKSGNSPPFLRLGAPGGDACRLCGAAAGRGARTRAGNGNRSVRAAEMPVRRGLLAASPDVLFKVG
jgi:hypothetical protein